VGVAARPLFHSQIKKPPLRQISRAGQSNQSR